VNKFKLVLTWLILILVLFSTGCIGGLGKKSYTLAVTVLNDADNTAVANAKVSVNGTTKQTLSTDKNGVVTFSNLNGLTYVSVEAENFDVKTQSLNINENKNLTIKLSMADIKLVRTVTELETALANPKITTIRLAANITATCNISRLVNLDLSSYTLTGSLTFDTTSSGELVFSGTGLLKGDLTVNTPNATVTNRINVDGDINIQAVASNSWYEEAINNLINLNGKGINLFIRNGAKEVKVNEEDNKIHIEGPVLKFSANKSVIVMGANQIETAVISAGYVVFDLPPKAIDEASTDSPIIKRLFEPGSGGRISPRSFGTKPALTFSGLYLHLTHQTTIWSSTRNEVIFSFDYPDYFGADSFVLQYSKNNGTSWEIYVDYNDNVVETSNYFQDNFVIYPDGEYLYRLQAKGGPIHGFTSNVVSAPLALINSQFHSWFMDESMFISGTMIPFVGRGIEVSAEANKLDENSTDVSNTLSYSWYRIDPYTFEMKLISGEHSQTYITTDADAGYLIGWRAAGDGTNSGGYLQVISLSRVVYPNVAFLSDITETGFNLNLYKSVESLTKENLFLNAYYDETIHKIEITEVKNIGNGSVFHISTQIPPQTKHLSLESVDSYWVLVTDHQGLHLSPGVFHTIVE